MASTAAVESVAGGIGSLIALVTTYPLKTIYTLQAIRLQQDSQGRSLSAAEKKELAGNPLKLLQSLLPSIGALYSGLQPAAIETTASNAIYFYFYSLLRAGVVSSLRARRGLPRVAAGSPEARREDIGVAASLLVAAAAGAINMVATSPAQVVCTQMQARSNLKRQLAARGQGDAAQALRSDAAGVAASIWQQDGAAGFWRGLAPNLLLVVNPAVQYMVYEWLTQRHTALKQQRLARTGAASRRVKLSAGEVFLLGKPAWGSTEMASVGWCHVLSGPRRLAGCTRWLVGCTGWLAGCLAAWLAGRGSSVDVMWAREAGLGSICNGHVQCCWQLADVCCSS
eukprot:GHRQ01009036.1.p1 GENE.GHRQ01009036.1~~GHRQ01009036.1.p1  ORF type:complete len:340 (+),score=110.08 GHRQ01009036.1:226-1245(+)